MKASLFLFLSLLVCMAIQAQDIDITGTWTMFEMTWTNGQDINTTTEDQLTAQGQSSDYFINPDGTFKMVSNMTGSGNLETYEGTWKLEGNKLTFGIRMGEDLRDIIWDFEFKDDVMNLKRTSPDGSISVVNRFKKN